MLPDPALTFTVPSIHDGTTLDCRVYHPASLQANPHAPPWRRHAAVLAHPYAPMGGCYDDPVLEVVAARLLCEGYLVGTFNFRGAGHSAGKTSWTSKPEREDYASVIGFLIYYIHLLDPFGHPQATEEHQATSATSNPTSPNRHGDNTNAQDIEPVFIIGGYSYGAVTTTHLPPLPAILETFASPASHSSAAQIRLRAKSLAEQQNIMLAVARQEFLEMHSPSSPVRRGLRIGGDEGGSPRPSTDSIGRKSLSRDMEEKFHGIVAKTRSSLHIHRHNHSHSSEAELGKAKEKDPAEGKLPAIPKLLMPRVAYLLVSPLPGLATHLVTMTLLPTALSRPKDPAEDPLEAKLIQNPTLAVYGECDNFVTTHKARSWAARLSSAPGSLFEGIEVASAGHFWAEEGVLHEMVSAVGDFASSLIQVDTVHDGHGSEGIQ